MGTELGTTVSAKQRHGRRSKLEMDGVRLNMD